MQPGAGMESWRNRKTLILSRAEMIGLLTPEEYNDCAEQAFRMHGEGRFSMEPKGHIVLDRYPGEWECMPAYIEEPEAAVCKWVTVREHNRERFDLPSVFSILIYSHPETGFPLALCDGGYHTLMRTGSSAAVSIKWLARADSSTLALVGAGHVASGVLAACVALQPWARVTVWSRTQAGVDKFLRDQQPLFPGLALYGSTRLEDVVPGADVVVTSTPARSPLVRDEWIGPGTHLAALGAAKAGDQELESALTARCRIFVDDIRQCRKDGEINVPFAQGLLGEESVRGELGEVIVGKKVGRGSAADITLFDSTGIALQDAATIPLEYERALAAGVGIEKRMIST